MTRPFTEASWQGTQPASRRCPGRPACPAGHRPAAHPPIPGLRPRVDL